MIKGLEHRPRAYRREARASRRRVKRIDPRCAHEQEQVPITALYRDLDGRLCHDHCGSPIDLQRLGRLEAVYRCFRCLENVYVPVMMLARIPTRVAHREIWVSRVAEGTPPH